MSLYNQLQTVPIPGIYEGVDLSIEEDPLFPVTTDKNIEEQFHYMPFQPQENTAMLGVAELAYGPRQLQQPALPLFRSDSGEDE